MKKQTLAFVKDDLSGLRMLSKEVFMNYLQDFGAGVKIKITLEHYFPQRSLKQNSVIHWYCTELANECGMQPEDFKMMMKMKFLKRAALNKRGEEMPDENGEVLTYIPSTSDLDTAEMATFIDQIRMFGIEILGYVLALPDENHKINFQEKLKDAHRKL
jgi:hypothetical protein